VLLGDPRSVEWATRHREHGFKDRTKQMDKRGFWATSTIVLLLIAYGVGHCILGRMEPRGDRRCVSPAPAPAIALPTGDLPSIGLIGIFKNEAHVLHEWCTHYIREGIDHIYLINDQSTDNWKSAIPALRDRITIVTTDDNWKPHLGHRQKYFYDKYYGHVKELHDWIMINDLDEFLYSRPPYPTIKYYLASLPPSVGHVEVMWTPFGSSGYRRSPPSVVKYYTWRMQTPSKQNPFAHIKAIVRTNNFDRLWVHHAETKGADKIFLRGEPEDPLRLNHYQIQSREFWAKKIKRGCVRADLDPRQSWRLLKRIPYTKLGEFMESAKHNMARSWLTFIRLDYRDCYDSELADKTAAHL
jgi:hypothetical protein